MAEYVQMRDAEGNVLFEVYNGNVVARTGTFENVRVSGTVSAGDPHGKRVLLDPDLGRPSASMTPTEASARGSTVLPTPTNRSCPPPDRRSPPLTERPSR